MNTTTTTIDEILELLADGRKRTKRQIIDAIPCLTTLYLASVPLNELMLRGDVETEKVRGVNYFWRSGMRQASVARVSVGPRWCSLVIEIEQADVA